MASETDAGFPYMEDTDPLGDVADHIEALARAITDRIGIVYHGKANLTGIGGSGGSQQVNYPEPMPDTARAIVLTVEGGNPGRVDVTHGRGNADGFVIYAVSSQTTSATVSWVALY